MNIFTLIALVLCGGTIAVDHLVRKLPHCLAIVLYTAGVALFITGLILSRRAGG